jgi:hypothetical protein
VDIGPIHATKDTHETIPIPPILSGLAIVGAYAGGFAVKGLTKRYRTTICEIRNDRERVRQCESLEKFALTEQIREILVDEQDHLIDLVTALGIDAPSFEVKERW